MGNEQALVVYKSILDGRSKYTYFILAAAAAAIGLAVNQTHESTISLSQVPLAIGVSCWAASFFCGCKHLDYVHSILDANLGLLQAQAGTHPGVGPNPQDIDAASTGIRADIEQNAEPAVKFSKRQFRLLVIGAVAYVVWHVIEMVLRTHCLPLT